MDDFPSNSSRRTPSRKEEPKKEVERRSPEKVIVGEVVRRKKPLSKRMRELFLGGDNRSIFEFIVQDVIIPNVRDMVFEAGQQGLERSLYGESQPFRRGVGSRPGDPRRHTNYNGISRGPARDRSTERTMSHRARATHDFGEIILPSRPEADAVLEGLYAILEEYDTVSVSDLYELVGISSHFTDRKWGWGDLMGSDIRRTREGWLLDLPRPEVID